MGKLEFTLPAMGEGIIEATITRWFVKVGTKIKKDDALVEVATDKVDSEIPSPTEGTITKIIYHEGEIPKVGEVLALIETDQDHVSQIQEAGPGDERINKSVMEITESKPRIAYIREKNKSFTAKSAGNELVITPYIRFLAKDREISFEELNNIKGSGADGRITRNDLHAYILSGRPFRDEAQAGKINSEASPSVSELNNNDDYVPGENEEIVPMDRTRKLIAEHMVRSKRTSPHVTSMVEIDVTPLVQWREQNKEVFLEKHGVKLTYTPVIVHAVTKALKLFPGINISVAGDKIIRKNYINIGVATALPDGNLVVPVIREADKRTFVNLALQLNDLAERSRQGKLIPSEIKGGTFTITNMGQYDNVSGTPIINQPEVAILAVGAIKKKPAVVRIDNTYSIGIREIMILSLTYDHRVVDGSLGGSFVRTIGKILEEELPDF